MRQILFLLSSSRPDGNSARLARRAAPAGAVCHWLDLATLGLPPFHDTRPAPPPPLAPVVAGVLAQMRSADDLVFVAPVYWYALPAPAKLLLDHWSGWLDDPDLGFAAMMAGKRLWLITTRADPDPDVPAPVEAMMARTALWLKMPWCGALHGVADAPGDITRDTATWAQAAEFLTLRQ